MIAAENRSEELERENNRRKQYLEQIESTVFLHRSRAFDYEKEAISYSTEGLKALTYLNGGALLAMPAAVPLFRADIEKIWPWLLTSGACFVAALVSIVCAQGFAFFTMAARSEAEIFYSVQQRWLINVAVYPDLVDVTKSNAEADENLGKGNRRIEASNRFRFWGICAYAVSLVLFIVGTVVGATSLLTSNPRSHQLTGRMVSALERDSLPPQALGSQRLNNLNERKE